MAWRVLVSADFPTWFERDFLLLLEFAQRLGVPAALSDVTAERFNVATRKAYAIFLKNPAHVGLRLERLKSDPSGWSVLITRSYRAVALRRGDDWFWVWMYKEFDRIFSV